MRGTLLTIDLQGLEAAARALVEQLGAEAREQQAYLHCFSDGRVSLELEWVDPSPLAEAVVVAYLTAVGRKQAQQ